jgi:hypothetical protein
VSLLLRGNSAIGKRPCNEESDTISHKQAHPPQLELLSASNPEATNASLPITISSYAMSALVNLGATINFVYSEILSAESSLQQYDNHVLLVGEGQKIEIEGICDLYFIVADLSVDTSFLESQELCFDIVLGDVGSKNTRSCTMAALTASISAKRREEEHFLIKRRRKNFLQLAEGIRSRLRCNSPLPDRLTCTEEGLEIDHG